MNKVIKALVASGLVVTGGIVVASKFTGDQAIEKAMTYVNDSYTLLEEYNFKQNILQGETQALKIRLSEANTNNESLKTEIKGLQEQIQNIELEKQKLIDKIKELEDQIANGDTSTDGLRVELEKANLEIEKANNRVKELENLLAEKDLSKFKPAEFETLKVTKANRNNFTIQGVDVVIYYEPIDETKGEWKVELRNTTNDVVVIGYSTDGGGAGYGLEPGQNSLHQFPDLRFSIQINAESYCVEEIK